MESSSILIQIVAAIPATCAVTYRVITSGCSCVGCHFIFLAGCIFNDNVSQGQGALRIPVFEVDPATTNSAGQFQGYPTIGIACNNQLCIGSTAQPQCAVCAVQCNIVLNLVVALDRRLFAIGQANGSIVQGQLCVHLFAGASDGEYTLRSIGACVCADGEAADHRNHGDEDRECGKHRDKAFAKEFLSHACFSFSLIIL